MNTLLKSKWLALSMCGAIMLAPFGAGAEDIDIFVGSSAGVAANPNVLIVLDNTSNWSRQSQKWPGGEQQGQSEVDAIKTVVQTLDSTINVGMMEFVTGSDANNNGGFIRYAIRPMSSTNKTNFSSALTTIYNNITDPDEKRNSGTAYGNLLYDVYNYFAGANQSQGGAATVAAKADSGGYTANYGTFLSPLSCDTNCAKNFVIFITNPDQSGPTHDDSPFTPGNTTNLSNLGGNTTQLALPNFTTTTTVVGAALGNTTQCIGAATCTAAAGTTANNAAFITAYAPSLATICADTSTYSNGCSCGTAQAGTSSCAAGTQRYSVIGTNSVAKTISASAKGADSGGNADWAITTSTTAPTFFAGMVVTVAGCPVGSGGKTLNGSDYAVTSSAGSVFHIMANKSAPACTSGTATFSNPAIGTSTTNLGYTTACYADLASCTTSDYTAACNSYPGGCACGSPTTTTGTTCAGGTSLYSVLGNNAKITNTPTGSSTTDTNPFNADEWARFLYGKGIPISGCDKQTVSTYTIDVYNAQPNAQHTALMMSMAKYGGGKYYNATNKNELVNDLKQIFAEIQSVNTTFASASLPVNATNRAQNENQVFIGMFRPDPVALPRWFGNMKRYQLINTSGTIDLGDAAGNQAINTQTGFLTDCAVSWWTSDSGTYWSTVPTNPPPTGTCTTTPYDVYSDVPDGPRVEKGAVAEVLRKGNAPPYSDTPAARPWAVNRTVHTLSGSSLAAFSTGTSGLSASLVDFTLGKDVNDEDGNANTTETRPSIHGDVIHSRPLPVNYGSAKGVTVFYGSNDGTLRAVEASTGKERWAFIAPEFYSALQRLKDNSPLVNYPNVDTSITPTPIPKNYFFDGSIGIYQNEESFTDAAGAKAWIYPTMRRGGRTIYAFDVTDPATPIYKWRAGCPNLTNDSGCADSTGAPMTEIGQTWSLPSIANIKGYPTNPVAVVGGGYDNCEDANSVSPSCTTPKGAGVYILDAFTGAVVKYFSFPGTGRSAVADVAMIDIDSDGMVDYAYAADTGGNIYRMDFINNPTSKTALASAAWTINRVAYTNGAGRKFLYSPALLAASRTASDGTKVADRVYLAIGSGDREHPLQTQYPYTDVLNRFYVYMDDLSSSTATNLDDTSKLTDFTSLSTCDTTGILPSSTQKGWFMNLNQNGAGEQTVTSAVILGGMATFSTNRPIPATAGTCSTALGEARGYWVNLFNASGAIGVSGACGGSRSSTFKGGGLPPSPVLGVVPINGKSTTVVIGAVQKSGSASSAIAPQSVKPPISSKRKVIYWKSSGDN